jgi:peptidoglycan/LPS O-acetylase OafA/YrhL
MSGKTDPGRLAFLDAGRALAAALVFLEHALHVCVPPFGEWSARHHVHLGRIGVLLFLTISGFIIPHSLQQGGSNARFWLRRFFRLFPAYWVCVLFAFLYARLGGQYTYVAPATCAAG